MSRVPVPAVGAILKARAAGRGGPRRRADPPSVVRARTALLSDVPLFADLPKRHLRRLAKLAGETSVRGSSVVVQAGQPGRAFFVILEGRAKVVGGVLGSGRKVAALGAGDCFGELALIDGGPRTASVVAETDLLTVRLSRTAFRQMLKAEPEVAIRLLEKLASIVRNQSPPASE